MKRLIALLLVLALTVSCLPAVFAQAPGEPEAADVWETITRIENQALSSTRMRVDTAEAQAMLFADLTDEVEEAVTSSAEYVPDSLVRNGDVLFWDTKDGVGMGYSPRLRAQMRVSGNPQGDPAQFSGIETTSFAARGGSPASKNVAVFQPYYGIDQNFTNQYPNEGVSIAQATGGTNTTYKTDDATIDNIAQAIESCGVVIFDSHGDTDYASGYDYTSRANTSYLCLQSGTGITAADMVSVQGPYSTYKHAYYAGGYGSMKYYCVDGTAISNHMTGDSPNGLLWMAICLGMATDGLQAPMRERGVEVVYGYSQSVTFSGDFDWEEYFWSKMKTGEMVKDAIAYMKQKGGVKDPYENSYPAYPIVVSSEDAYPGHGNVDKVQQVKSTWVLLNQYKITAYANNSQWGTVRVLKDTVTAIPAVGYYTAGAEVVAGTAVITQTGDSFVVEPESDCEIRVDFAPKTPAVVHFSTPEGISCPDLNTYVNDEVTLPVPEQTPEVEGRTFRFLGWAMAPVETDTRTLPMYLQGGDKLEVTEPEMTVYALYSYFVAANGLQEDQFVQVEQAPESWTGEYVISWQGKKALNASGTAKSSAIGGSSGVVDLESVGAYVENKILNGVTDDLIFLVSPSGNGTYTVKMKNKNYFLALAADADGLTTYTSSNTDKTRWMLSFENGSPVLKNAAYSGRRLRYLPDSNAFKACSGGGDALTLFTCADGDMWYTTVPKARTECETHVYGEWINDTNPTCTEPGTAYRICAVCGNRENTEIPALGHDYTEVVTEPTCTEAGFTTHTCTRCGDSFTDGETPALGHDYTEAVTEPTCTETGFTTHTCTRCGDSFTDGETPALGHDYTEAVTEPTCTETGFTTHTCTRCGDSFTDSETPALGHDFEDGICTRCGAEDPDYVALTAPELTAANVKSTGKIKLTWTQVEGADNYVVYRATKVNGTWKALGTVAKTNYTNTGAVAGNTYYYKVVPVRNFVEGPASEVVSATCLLAQPVVTGTHVASSGKNKLTWEAVPGAVSYLVLRATEKDGVYHELKTTENTSFINTGAKTGVTYYYQVQAISSVPAANSALSAVKTLTCDLPRPVVSIQLTSAGKPKLTWNAIDQAVSYKIYRAEAAEGPYKMMYTTENTTYTNTKYDPNTTYFYKVVAVHEKSAANSAYSTVVSITTK